MALSNQVTPAFVHLAAHPVRWRLLTELAVGDLRVRELTALIDAPQNLVSYHLRLLRDGGLVTATRSSFDGRDSYYRLDLDHCAQALADTGTALHPALRRLAPPGQAVAGRGPLPRVLFICTGNSARSPIAEALLRHRTSGHLTVTSAGSSPKPAIHPYAVQVLQEEYGVDIAGQHPRHLKTLHDRGFDYVITLCDKAREVCPDFGDQTRRIHWSIPDPARTTGLEPAGRAAFSQATADIDTRVRYLLPVLSQTPEDRP